MTDILGETYSLEEHSFSIQYMHRKGYYSMASGHFHPYYEILYLLQGERIYFINDTVYTAQAGDLVIVNPHDLHQTSSSEAPGFERILINFKHEFIHARLGPGDPQLLPFAQGSRLVRFPLKEQPAVDRLIRDMLAECTERGEGYEAYVRSSLMKLLVLIHRQLRREDEEPPHYAHPMHEKISEIAAFLNSHYQDELTLEQVSKQFYISPSYLSRIFKKITGFHFREYLLVIRVREAQRMLLESQHKILSISELVGFRHISHFNTTFKKITGISPLQYRKRQLEIGREFPYE